MMKNILRTKSRIGEEQNPGLEKNKTNYPQADRRDGIRELKMKPQKAPPTNQPPGKGRNLNRWVHVERNAKKGNRDVEIPKLVRIEKGG